MIYFSSYINILHSGVGLIEMDDLKGIINYLLSKENNNDESDREDELPVSLIKSLY